MLLGPSSRFGALLPPPAGQPADALPILSGLHHSGYLPTYNWFEVAETHRRVPLEAGGEVDLGDEAIERLFALLFDLLPLPS